LAPTLVNADPLFARVLIHKVSISLTQRWLIKTLPVKVAQQTNTPPIKQGNLNTYGESEEQRMKNMTLGRYNIWKARKRDVRVKQERLAINDDFLHINKDESGQ